MTFNKEKLVCLIAVLLLIGGIAFAFGNWPGGATEVVTMPEVDRTPDEPRFTFQEPRLMGRDFKARYNKILPAERPNPFQADSGRRTVKASDYPLPNPWERPLMKVVPVPGTLGKEQFRNMLMQSAVPDEITSASSEETEEDEEGEWEAEEDSEEETEETTGEEEEVEGPYTAPRPAPVAKKPEEEDEELEEEEEEEVKKEWTRKELAETFRDLMKMSKKEQKEYIKNMDPELKEALKKFQEEYLKRREQGKQGRGDRGNRPRGRGGRGDRSGDSQGGW